MNKRICMCCGRPIINDNSSNWHTSCIEKMFGTKELPVIDIDEVTEQKYIDLNITSGNALTGVQKKFSFDFSSSTSSKRKTVHYETFQHIIKTASKDMPLLPEWEWIGMSLARICNIKTVDFALYTLKDKSNIFICKRFDRITSDNQCKKIPVEDFAQLSNTLTENKYRGSYERCYQSVISKYSSYKTVDAINFFRIVFFSYLIGNTDMHLKNFSLYSTDSKHYTLSPAYDLLPVLMVFNQQDMALTINGKQRNITKNDFKKFAAKLDINEIITNKIMDEIINKKSEIVDFIQNTEVISLEDKERFISLVENRISIL